MILIKFPWYFILLEIYDGLHENAGCIANKRWIKREAFSETFIFKVVPLW